MSSELYNEIDYDEDYIGCFYAYKSETNHRRYKTCRINIFIKEICGNVPHMYLVNYHGDTCRVKLLTNEYFRDEKDGDQPYLLTKLEEEALDRKMHSFPTKESCVFWEFLLMEWNNKWLMGRDYIGDDGVVDFNTIGAIPDYIAIKEDIK